MAKPLYIEKCNPEGFFELRGDLSRMGKDLVFLNIKGKNYVHWTFVRLLVKKHGAKLKDLDGWRRMQSYRRETLDLKAVEPDYNYQKFFRKSKVELRPYQTIGANFMYCRRNVLLADDVGLGKTIQTLAFVARMVYDKDCDLVVVVVPSSLKYQWYREVVEKLHPKLVKITAPIIVEGEKPERGRAYRRVAESRARGKVPVVFINYELLYRDTKFIRHAFRKYKRRIVVGDEASRIKNANTQTNRILRGMFNDAPAKAMLTATPIENGVEDLYGIMHLLDRRILWSDAFMQTRHYNEIMLETTIRNKRGQVFKKKFPKIVGYRNLKELKYRLEDFVIQRTVDNTGLDLPSIVPVSFPVTLTKTQTDLYNALADNTVEGVDTSNPMVCAGALRRCCASPTLFDIKGQAAKTVELKTLLKTELRGRKVIVFSESKRYVKELEKELNAFKPLVIHGDVDNRVRNIREVAFEEGKASLLLMTSAGERGLNFPSCEVIVNADVPYNPARMKQRIGRARRFTSTHEHISVINMYAVGTVEERVLDIFTGKAKLFDRLFDDSFDLSSFNIEKWSSKRVKSLLSA